MVWNWSQIAPCIVAVCREHTTPENKQTPISRSYEVAKGILAMLCNYSEGATVAHMLSSFPPESLIAFKY